MKLSLWDGPDDCGVACSEALLTDLGCENERGRRTGLRFGMSLRHRPGEAPGDHVDSLTVVRLVCSRS